MIVQFLNGTQFESNLPVEQLKAEIYQRRAEFGLELMFPAQLSLLLQEDDPVLYAIVMLVENVAFGDMMDSFADIEDDRDRYKTLTRYYQFMACRRKLSFEKDHDSYYIVDKEEGTEFVHFNIREFDMDPYFFNRPERMINYRDLFPEDQVPPAGWKVWYHWAPLHGQNYPLCTLVHYEDNMTHHM